MMEQQRREQTRSHTNVNILLSPHSIRNNYQSVQYVEQREYTFEKFKSMPVRRVMHTGFSSTGLKRPYKALELSPAPPLHYGDPDQHHTQSGCFEKKKKKSTQLRSWTIYQHLSFGTFFLLLAHIFDIKWKTMSESFIPISRLVLMQSQITSHA